MMILIFATYASGEFSTANAVCGREALLAWQPFDDRQGCEAKPHTNRKLVTTKGECVDRHMRATSVDDLDNT